MTSTATTSTLGQLLDAELRFSPSIREIYSNHLAMELVALDQLGAAPEVLQHVFDVHARGEAEPRRDADALAALRGEVRRVGIATAVRRLVPPLATGPSTALFHPLIRLAYALDVGDDGQVAAALLDWSTRRHVLVRPEPVPGDRRLPDVAADLSARPDPWAPTYDLDAIAARPELQAAVHGLAVDDHTLDDVSAFVINAHATAEAFVTLHMVTGARAVRAVAGWLDDETASQLIGWSAHAMVVAYAAAGAPALLDESHLDAIRHQPVPSPEAIAAHAIDDLDPHVVKLVNVALVEEARTGDPLYRYAAARVTGLVPRVR
jgi:hypothetical protein